MIFSKEELHIILKRNNLEICDHSSFEFRILNPYKKRRQKLTKFVGYMCWRPWAISLILVVIYCIDTEFESTPVESHASFWHISIYCDDNGRRVFHRLDEARFYYQVQQFNSRYLPGISNHSSGGLYKGPTSYKWHRIRRSNKVPYFFAGP